MAAGFEDEDDFDAQPARDETAGDPKQRATEAFDQIRLHAELCAVFEGPRKFEASILPLDDALARELQRGIGGLAKQKKAETGPLLPPGAMKAAGELLAKPAEMPRLTTGDYHVLRRPNEAMIVRWLDGDAIDTFYERFAAHANVALEQKREDERQELGWRQDEDDQAYLDALDKLKVEPATWYLRDLAVKKGAHVLSTMTVGEMNILYLCDTIMGVPAIDVVGKASAPDPDDGQPADSEITWHFNLFSLRGRVEKVERMMFFAYLQRATDDLW